MVITRRRLITRAAALPPTALFASEATADVIHTVIEMNLDNFEGVWPGGAYNAPSPYTAHKFTIPANIATKSVAIAVIRSLKSPSF